MLWAYYRIVLNTVHVTFFLFMEGRQIFFFRHSIASPAMRLISYNYVSFSVSGPSAWNTLPDYLRDPALSKYF